MIARASEDASGSADRTESTSTTAALVAGRFSDGPGRGSRLRRNRDAPAAQAPQSRSTAPPGPRAPTPLQPATTIRGPACPSPRVWLSQLGSPQGRGAGPFDFTCTREHSRLGGHARSQRANPGKAERCECRNVETTDGPRALRQRGGAAALAEPAGGDRLWADLA